MRGGHGGGWEKKSVCWMTDAGCEMRKVWVCVSDLQGFSDLLCSHLSVCLAVWQNKRDRYAYWPLMKR